MPKRMNLSPLKIRNWKPVLLIALLAAGFVWFLKTNTSILEGMEDKDKDKDNDDTTKEGTSKGNGNGNGKGSSSSSHMKKNGNGKAKNGDSSKPMSADDVKKMLSNSTSS